jgi:hypothetical protein
LSQIISNLEYQPGRWLCQHRGVNVGHFQPLRLLYSTTITTKSASFIIIFVSMTIFYTFFDAIILHLVGRRFPRRILHVWISKKNGINYSINFCQRLILWTTLFRPCAWNIRIGYGYQTMHPADCIL